MPFNSFKKTILNNAFMLKYIFKFVPLYAVFSIIVGILNAVSSILLNVMIAKYLIDAIQFGKSVATIVIFLSVISGYYLIVSMFKAYFTEVVTPKANETLYKKMQGQLFVKATQIDLACYDNPTFYNDIVWATSQADTKAMEIYSTFCSFLQSLATIGGLIAAILILEPIGLALVLVSFILNFLINIFINKLTYKCDIELKPVERKRDYTSRVFYLLDFAKEIRLSNVKKLMINKFKTSSGETKSIIRKYANKLTVLSFIKTYFFNNFIFNFLFLLSLAHKALIVKTIAYGSFVGAFNSVLQLRDNIGNFVTILPQFYKHSLYVDNFKTFLNYQQKIIDKENPKPMPSEPKQIELKNVSFTYDECSEPVLKNISLTIKPYEKIAIVGYNGAGKSTLIKLIMRLYDVTSGKIEFDGEDIKNYGVRSYRDSFGTVFQDYQLFSASIAENVLMDRYEKEEKERVTQALYSSDFENKLNSYKYGINTPLTREFEDDGELLSGGETQKVAVSRVFAKKCTTVILDEPSSALDPISEYNLNKNMFKAAKDKTVIFISHRLSTTRDADRIYMIEKGEIAEFGTHRELMEQNGKYAHMFNLQAKRYKNTLDDDDI